MMILSFQVLLGRLVGVIQATESNKTHCAVIRVGQAV